MALPSWSVDDAGNITERCNESCIRQSRYFNPLAGPSADAEFGYPLTVSLSGSGIRRIGG